MNYFWIGFGGGGLIGGLIGYLIGRKCRRKQEPVAEIIADREEPEEEAPSYAQVIAENNYYVDNDIDDDIEEIDEYFASKEAPEDDEPEETVYSRAYFITQDDYYTSRPDYEKTSVWYRSDEDKFYDAEGNDQSEGLLEDGLKIHEMLREFSKDDITFWRDDFTKTDYEIRMEEGE